MLISGKGAAGGLGSSEEAVVRVSHPSHPPRGSLGGQGAAVRLAGSWMGQDVPGKARTEPLRLPAGETGSERLLGTAVNPRRKGTCC